MLLLLAFVSAAIAQENETFFLHTVEKGQTLYSISSMYGVSQNDIIALNPGSDEKIYVGRTLKIPLSKAGSRKETFHTIVQGETLYRLTKQYGVSAKEICDANPGLSADNFRIGEVIRIPAARSVQQPDTVPSPVIQAPVVPRCRDMHKIKRKETIYSISRKYGISEAELIAANPELKGGQKIKKGEYLCIPYPATKAAPPPLPPSNYQLFEENKKEPRRINTVRAAIILPFLESRNETSARMVEYYEGFLMAVDSLKRRGTSIDLYTYNSGSESSSLKNILAKEELKRMDIIFGPLHPSHIAPLAEFADKNQIRLVIPFTSKDNTVFHNPSIFQINTPQSYLYSEVYEHFVREFPNGNIVFMASSGADNDEKAEFINGLKEALRNRAIPMTTVSEDATPEELKTTLRNDRENIFIPTSGSNAILIKVIPQLTLLARELPETSIRLFGYPEWQTYTKDHLDAFFELDAYFYSSFYTNNLLPAAINFIHNYRRWYSKMMDERYPRYGMLGFDTGYFFLSGLSRYGSTFEEKMGDMNLVSIQTGFKFERVNNFGGFINRKVFFVHFTKGYEVMKLDFD
jgi:LysM repeat protein/lambda repressor-like predicted transcriptional regulator